jgi:hypothetical protein
LRTFHCVDFFKQHFLRTFGFVFGLNLIFLLVQLVLLSSPSFRENLFALIDSPLGLPASQYWRFIEYGLAQLLMYGMFTLVVTAWILLGLSQIRHEVTIKNETFLIWAASVTLLYVLNIWAFPASRFNVFILPGHSALPVVFIALIWFCYQSRWSFYSLGLWLRCYYRWVFVALVVIFLIKAGWMGYERYARKPVQVSNQPNVLLIGLDDLRPDVLSKMPNLRAFLANSTDFTESVTPEARTFVAWTSLLTGLYPKEHGIHFDMQSVHGYVPPGSLAQILKEHGYTTVYSTDDNQYADVNQSYGFDHLVVPKMDAAEYLLTLMGDMPLQNMIAHTWVGKVLFPDTYNNRAAAFVYNPVNYNAQVFSALDHIPSRPLFLAIHFNLSHQPFYWSKRPLPVVFPGTTSNVSEVYALAAEDMDAQFGAFMAGLNDRGLLKNSIVIVFSDHGESLALPRERLISLDTYIKGQASGKETLPALNLYSPDYLKFDQMLGHGTDILSKVQWHQILGVHWFSHAQYRGKIPQRVSLIDVKPTVLDLLGISSTSSGESLAKAVLSGKISATDRYFYIDTGFNPFAIEHMNDPSNEEIRDSLKYFEVLPTTGRLIIRPTLIPELIDQIQHAVVYQHWILAVYPSREHKKVWVLVDMNTRQWTDDFSTPFAKQAPVAELVAHLSTFYGNEINSTS